MSNEATPKAPKFRYFIVGEDWTVRGTNDRAAAMAAAKNVGDGEIAVIDAVENVELMGVEEHRLILQDTDYNIV